MDSKMHTSNGIDMNKVNKVETPYGNGYYYGGRLYSEEDFNKMLQGSQSGTAGGGNFRHGGNAGKNANDGKTNDLSKGAFLANQTRPSVSSLQDPNIDPSNKTDNAPESTNTTPQVTQKMYNDYRTQGRNTEANAILLQHPEYKNENPSPPLANMLSSNPKNPNTSDETRADDLPQNLMGKYGDVVIRNGKMATGVTVTGSQGNYQIHYDPVYEQSLQGSGTNAADAKNTSVTQPAPEKNPNHIYGNDIDENGNIIKKPDAQNAQNTSSPEIIQPNPKGTQIQGNGGKPQGQPQHAQFSQKAQPKVPPPSGLGMASVAKGLSANPGHPAANVPAASLFRKFDTTSGTYMVVDSKGKAVRAASPQEAQSLKDFDAIK